MTTTKDLLRDILAFLDDGTPESEMFEAQRDLILRLRNSLEEYER